MPSRSLLLKLSMQSVKHFSTRLLYMRRLHAQKGLSGDQRIIKILATIDSVYDHLQIAGLI